MTWRKLLTRSLTAAAIAVAGISFAAPRQAATQVPCGAFSGSLCVSDCTKECSDGSCCQWRYYYYFKQGTDTLPEGGPPILE